MRGPWSRKQPLFVTIKSAVERTEVQPLGKAKRVSIKVASEKTQAAKGD